MREMTSIVIYGATGDLSHRKLLPALYNLFRKRRLPEPLTILGLGRKQWDTAEFTSTMRAAVETHSAHTFSAEVWDRFAPMLDYLPGNFTDDSDYPALVERMNRIDGGEGNRLFYLAMPPRFYEPIIEQLDAFDLVDEALTGPWRRVIIEKPFGHDLPSALALNESIHKHLKEPQIYRIDHYLAKETVQNMMVFRFGNSIFEPLWNRNYIDHVQITAIETVDVGSRASYYDRAGVVRDMFQNHLMQLLSIVSMEPPSGTSADALRNEKVKALSAVRRWTSKEVSEHSIRAQYDGYLQADGVPAESQTPTFATMQLFLDNWRWQGVPFYLRSGKAMAEKLTEITIQFKQAPVMMFAGNGTVPGNTLTFTIQPDEGIHLKMETKVPDSLNQMQPVNMHFHYADAFDNAPLPEAYERLLGDALKGDASLFTRDDEVENAWQIIDPFLQAWEVERSSPIATYEPGSWGPVEADAFLAKDGRAWLNGIEHRQLVMP